MVKRTKLRFVGAVLSLAATVVVPASAKIVKGPYLQNVQPDGITIMWESDQPTIGIVLYGKTPGHGGSVEEAEPRRIHEVHIRGLEIETSYHYKVLSGRDASAGQTFRTAVRPDSPFRFVYYGDNKNGPHMHRRNSLQISAERPDLVLQCGDLVSSGEIYSQWERLFFTPAQPLIDHVPIYPSLGNHERNARHYFDYFSLPRTESWYSFEYGNTHFAVLDSNADHLREDSPQVEWLISDLKASQAVWTVVSFHHPPFTAGGNYYTEHRIRLKRLLHPIFETHGVDLVFNGHDHNYERTRPIRGVQGRNAVTYVVNGNGGTPLRYIGQREWTAVSERVFGYTLVNVRGKRLELQAKTVEGEVIDTLVIDKGDAAAYRAYLDSALAYETIQDPLETSRLLDAAEDTWERAEDNNDDHQLYARALEMARKAHELDPTCAECVVAMGIVNTRLGHKDLGIEQLRQGMMMKPQFPDSYEELVDIYMDDGQFKEALEVALRWTKVEPDQADPHEALAEIYLKQGEPAKAIAALRRALEIVPSDEGAHEDLAELYEELGLNEQAAEHYLEAMNWIDAEDTRQLQKYLLKIEALRR